MDDDDEEYLSERAKRFVLATSLIRDACVSRLEISYKKDITSVRSYEEFYSGRNITLFYIFTFVNLSTILIEYPPSFIIPGIHERYYIPVLINFCCELFFYYRWYLIFKMSDRESFKKNVSSILSVIILFIMTIDTITFLILSALGYTKIVRVSRMLRPILLLTFPENRRLRAAFYNLRRTTADVAPVFGLVIVTVLFLGIATITLYGESNITYASGDPYFNDFGDIMWELYVLVTTSNSPDVIIPAYEYHRSSIWLYITTCAVCNWLFLAIFTASVYNAYKSHLGEFVATSVAARKKKLDEAFSLVHTYTDDGVPAMSQSTFIRLMRIAMPKRTEDSLKVLFHILDQNRSGYLGITEFARLSEYMQVKLLEIDLSPTFFRHYIPKCYKLFVSSWFQVIRRIMLHQHTRFFFSFMVIANVVAAIVLRSYTRAVMVTSGWFFMAIFLIEWILNLLVAGGPNFFNDKWNVFDTIIVFTALVGQIIQEVLNGINIEVPAGIIHLLLIVRVLRVLKLFSAIEKFRVVLGCISTITPSLMAYSAILMILCYIFACFGMEMYAYLYITPPGYQYDENTNCSNEKLKGSEFVAMHYCMFNFNSATESFILLFVLCVGNNWQIFAEGFITSTSKWSRLFFVLVHWTCVLLVLNVVLAFIIEAFLIEFDARQTHFEQYIMERLQELGVDASNELKERNLQDYRKIGFYITHEHLAKSFPPGTPRRKAFLLQQENTSIELLMFRMFEQEIEELIESYRTSIRRVGIRAHDVLGQTIVPFND